MESKAPDTLEKINKIFLSFKYGDKYKGVLITLYLGDFEYTPSISTPYLSNFSVKDKEWNFKGVTNASNVTSEVKEEKKLDTSEKSILSYITKQSFQ